MAVVLQTAVRQNPSPCDHFVATIVADGGVRSVDVPITTADLAGAISDDEFRAVLKAGRHHTKGQNAGATGETICGTSHGALSVANRPVPASAQPRSIPTGDASSSRRRKERFGLPVPQGGILGFAFSPPGGLRRQPTAVCLNPGRREPASCAIRSGPPGSRPAGVPGLITSDGTDGARSGRSRAARGGLRDRVRVPSAGTAPLNTPGAPPTP
jgi:hypothetical protein